MKYVGSKRKISQDICPIIQNYINKYNINNYIEPFCGSCSIIENIECKNRYAYDNNKYLIALLLQAQTNADVFPKTYTKDFYDDIKANKNNGKYPDWLIGLAGFSTFGAKWFGGFPRGFKEDKITPRDIVNESIRNIQKQAPKLKNINFECKDFRDIIPDNTNDYLIYCDPPYKNTTKYATGEFPYEEFYIWCKNMSKNNIVLISEYNMPKDFECIWQKTISTSLDCNRTNDTDKQKRIEKLFIMKGICK